MKRVFSMMVLTVLVGAAIQAQQINLPNVQPSNPWPTALPSWSTKPGGMKLAVDPKSAIKDATGRYGTDIDNFLGVTDWSGVEYTNWFFFLGGTAATMGDTGFQGGLAKKLGDSHLAVYFNGNFAQGKGYNNGEDDPSNQDSYGEAQWKDALSILFGNPFIGGIRLNLLFDGTFFLGGEMGRDSFSGMNDPQGYFISILNQITGNSGNTDTPLGSRINKSGYPLITSLQWGKQFGLFTPKLTVGFRWPDKLQFDQDSTSITVKVYDHAQLGILLEAAYGDFSGDYQVTVDFGPTIEETGQPDSTYSGYQHHNINLKYAFTLDVDEKLQFKLRPTLNFQIFNTAAEGNIKGTIANGRPWGYFAFDPIVELGARYTFSPKVRLYSGIKAELLGLTRYYSSAYGPAPGQSKINSEPSFWDVRGINLTGGNLAVQINPSERLSIEISLMDLIHYNTTDSKGQVTTQGWNLNFTSLGGGIAVVIKP